MKRLMLFTFTVIGFSALVSGGTAHATMRSVPGSYPSIQAAINAAQNGDEVVVSAGTYRENIEIVGKYITVRSLSDASQTIIAGNPGKTPVMIQNVPYRVGGTARLSGFKITGGYAPDGQGGGITIANNADPIIDSNIIENNQSVAHGGGILVFNNSNPHIRNNSIRNNHAVQFGGGIFVVKNSSPTISENYIQFNSVSSASIPNGGSSGGGIYLEDDTSNLNARSKPVVVQNDIRNNTAEFAGGGIMLRVGVDAIIQNNGIYANQAAYGGGIHIETEGSHPQIIGNTIQSNTAGWNSAFAGSGFGGGISVYASSNPTIIDNTIGSNDSSKGGGGIVVAENSSASIHRNTISLNQAKDTGADGGGIYIANAHMGLVNNIIDSNTAQHCGGGIALFANSSSDVVHNTVVKNNAGNTQGGGAVFIANAPGVSSNIIDNIIGLNQKYQIFEDGAKAKIENNIIQNSGSGLYFNYTTNGITSVTTLNNSNAVNAAANSGSDPLFVNASSSDYHLSTGSPAIGLAQAIGLSEDKDYLMRPVGGGTDSGVYEYNDGSGVTKQPVYRFWSEYNKTHFYTINADERNGLIFTHPPQEWRYEGPVYYAFTANTAGATPLYRFWSDTYHGHFYTVDSNERDYVINNYPQNVWKYEDVAFYVYPLSYSGSSQTVDRFWSDTYHHHFYTANQSESNNVQTTMSNIWTYEGQRFKVPR